MLREAHVRELTDFAKNGDWSGFATHLESGDISSDDLNIVPAERAWGVIHQIASWGSFEALECVRGKFPGVDLQLSTVDEACNSPLDIALSCGHADFAATLRAAAISNLESSPDVSIIQKHDEVTISRATCMYKIKR